MANLKQELVHSKSKNQMYVIFPYAADARATLAMQLRSDYKFFNIMQLRSEYNYFNSLQLRSEFCYFSDTTALRI